MTGGRPRRPSLLFRRVRALTLLVVLVGLVVAGVHLVRGDGPTSAAVRPEPVVPAPTPTPAQTVQQAVESWQRGGRGALAVAVADLATGRQAEYGATGHAFATASVVKVDILCALLLQRQGRLTPGQRALAERMIRQSSNGAATSLWRTIGRERGLDAANATLGLTATRAGTRGRWGATTTTTADQLRLLRVVFTDDSPLDAASRRYVATLMGGVAADQDWGVSAADTRAGAAYAVKNGWLPRSGGWVVTSVGSVEHGGHPLLVVALSDGGTSQARGVKVLELVARNAAADLTGV